MSATGAHKPGTVITIGNFDGVHIGHARLIELARQRAGLTQDGGCVVAMVFDPHPKSVLRPETAPHRLSTFAQRKAWLTSLGVDEVVRLEPTPELLGLAPRAFIERLVGEREPVAFVEGPGFGFGRGRAGNVQTLATLGQELGFDMIVADKQETALWNQIIVPVSSTLVRTMVHDGRVNDAQRLLGRPYEMTGRVVRGDQRGRAIGIPTANLETQCLLPLDGVYAGRARFDHQGEPVEYPAAIHVGPRPVFGLVERTVEAHIIGYDRPLPVDDIDYGWALSLVFDSFLRDQMKLESVDKLKEQIDLDIKRAQSVYANLQAGIGWAAHARTTGTITSAQP